MKFNINKLQEVTYDFFEEFMGEALQALSSYKDEFASIDIFVSSSEVKRILSFLHNYKWDYIEYENIDYDGDYIISVWKNKTIFCEKALMGNGNYFDYDSKSLKFVSSECRKSLLDFLDDSTNDIVLFSIE